MYSVDSSVEIISEEYNFEDGCFGKTQHQFFDRFFSEFDNIKDLYNHIKSELNVKDKNEVIINHCRETNRKEKQWLSVKGGCLNRASSASTNKWKKGEINLWLNNASVYVKKTENANLIGLEL